MKVAVYDTYVNKSDNTGTYYFDIIVEKNTFSNNQVIEFGKEHLNKNQVNFQDFSVDECQFCHIESPTEKMIEVIKAKGYDILVFDDIPSELPENPTRSHIIQHIRAVNKSFRFANLSSYSEKDLLNTLN